MFSRICTNSSALKGTLMSFGTAWRAHPQPTILPINTLRSANNSVHIPDVTSYKFIYDITCLKQPPIQTGIRFQPINTATTHTFFHNFFHNISHSIFPMCQGVGMSCTKETQERTTTLDHVLRNPSDQHVFLPNHQFPLHADVTTSTMAKPLIPILHFCPT